MTRTLAVDSLNDLYIGADGNIAVAQGLQAVLVDCQCAAQARLGEMVLNQDQGLPFFETIFAGGYNVAQYVDALRATLLAVPDVTNVAIDTNVTAGVLSYTAVITTIYGTGTING